MARIQNMCSLGLSCFLVVLLATDLVLCQPGENRNRGRKHKRGRGNKRRDNGNGNGGEGPPGLQQHQVQYTPPAPTYPTTAGQQDQWGNPIQGGLMPPVPLPAPKIAAPYQPRGPAVYPSNFARGPPPAAPAPLTGGIVPSPLSYNPNAFANQDCYLTADPGNCPVDRIVYYYDMNSQTCKPFWYGCNGNENRHETYYACMDSCAPVPQFPLPQQPSHLQQGHQFQGQQIPQQFHHQQRG